MADSAVAVRRVLTDTPLARRHEKLVFESGSRRHKPIPFERFHRDTHPAPALRLALDAQRALALGEYQAVDLFSRICSALALNGAPFDVVAAAARIPSDEIRHADMTIRMARMLAGRDVEVKMDRAVLEKRWQRPIGMRELDEVMIEVPAIGETLACALLDACRERARDPTMRALYASIVADEVHHARLGWYWLAWRAKQWTREDRQHASDRAGALVMQIERRFWNGRDAPRGFERAARALGVLESEGQREVVRRTMEEEIVPGLDALGLGASHAWRIRRRGK